MNAFRNMMPWTQKLLKVLFPLAVLPLGACAVFSCRHHRWEGQIQRDDAGVADFALPLDHVGGETAVLMVHGFGDGPRVWQSLAPELAERGFRVRAMRLPGWGEPMAVKQSVTTAEWLGSIESEIAALRGKHREVVVMAHSMGACLSILLAQEGRLDADALILYAPMFAVSDTRSPLLPTRRWFAIGRSILPDSMVVESLFPDHTRVADPRPRTFRDPFVPIRVFSMLYAAMDAVDTDAPVLSLPVRLVLPGEDHVVRTDISRTWFEHLSAPDKTLVEVPGAGHVLPLDINSLEESHRIVVWLAERVRDPQHSPETRNTHTPETP